MERKRLYMFAIVPPADLSDRIISIKKEFAEAYNCKAALKAPVHITLHPPYKECEDHEAKARKILSNWLGLLPRFTLNIRDFEAFHSNGVIFLNVEKNDDLIQLHAGLAKRMTNLLSPQIKDNQPYHPHITIGYRDIPKELFAQAVEDFQSRRFEACFEVESAHFWRHNGKIWETIATFPLYNHSQ